MKVLVTGLSGFTGHYMKLELEVAGHVTEGLSSDLTDPDAVNREIDRKQPEAVIHLAGVSSVDHENANAFYEVNLIGTRNLLSALDQYGRRIKSVLLVSSANIYGNQNESLLSEDSIPNPCSDYAISKLAMEQMALLWLKQLPLFIVRPFNYTGVGQSTKFLIPKIIEHFQMKRPNIELGNIDVFREFGDVRDVAHAYRRLIECPPVGKTINTCTSKTYSIKDIIKKCTILSKHIIKIRINEEYVRENEIKNLQGSNLVMKKILGNLKTRDLDDTLKWMLEKW